MEFKWLCIFFTVVFSAIIIILQYSEHGVRECRINLAKTTTKSTNEIITLCKE